MQVFADGMQRLGGLVLIVSLAPASPVSHAADEASRPSFVFLLADDLGWGDLACQGHPYIKTPNIDRLAAEGTRFENFYVCGSVCHPSRATFMTGQFLPHCFGDVHTLPDGRRVNVSMAPGSLPLTRLLQQAGHKTAHVGKWHLNSDAFIDPGRYGLNFFHSGQRLDLGEFQADMQAGNGQDQKMGEVLSAIKELGLEENTVVFYSSDNGPPLPARTPESYVEEVNGTGSSGPYRARKFTYFEGGIRVPAIVRWPGHVPAGRVDRESVWAAVDWLPTVCSLARATTGDDRPDGRDVSEVWFGATRRCDRELVWGLMPERMAIRGGDWKLDEYRDEVSLFNLAVDPCENRNLAESQPERAKLMPARLAEYRAELEQAHARGAKAALEMPNAAGKTSERRRKAANRKS